MTANGLPGGLDQLGRLVHAFDGIPVAREFVGISACPTTGIEQRRAWRDPSLDQPGRDRCALLTDRTIDQQIERPCVLSVEGTAGVLGHGSTECRTTTVGQSTLRLFNLLRVSTGDGWVVRNWSDVSTWTTDTAPGVLLKDLKAAHGEGLKYNVALPFNALASVLLFDSMGKQLKPKL